MVLPPAHRRTRRHGSDRVTTGRTPVTIARAAETLGIGERDIRRWITARLLTSYIPERGVAKPGTRVVILEDVIALDQRLRQQARTRTPRARLRRDYLAALSEHAKPADGTPT